MAYQNPYMGGLNPETTNTPMISKYAKKTQSAGIARKWGTTGLNAKLLWLMETEKACKLYCR